MNRKSRLPTICRWIFAACTVLALIGAVVVVIMMVIGPLGTAGKGTTHISGQVTTEVSASPAPGTLMLQSKAGSGRIYVSEITAVVSDKDAGPLRQLTQTYGLPFHLVDMLFLVIVFDLLRRLFRNVERGESFTPQTIRLVRLTGLSLIVFSLVSAVLDGMFSGAVMEYLRTHAILSEPAVRWLDASPHEARFHINLESPIFFAGLLILALSEVFRQGLALKNENDLTI